MVDWGGDTPKVIPQPEGYGGIPEVNMVGWGGNVVGVTADAIYYLMQI